MTENSFFKLASRQKQQKLLTRQNTILLIPIMDKRKLFVFLILLISVATTGAGELELSLQSKEKNSDKILGNYLAYNLTTSANNNEGKIIGGEPTTPHELPYQLAIKKFKKDIVCGAVLLSPGHALTAAHCLDPQRITELEDYEVVAGAHSLKDGNEMEQRSVITEVIMHPDYNRETLANDLAVLKLMDKFKVTSAVQTINISTPRYVAKGSALASGWGITQEGGFASDLLLKVNLTIWEENNIKKCDFYSNFDSNTMLCVGGVDGKGICSGDSGGPLVITEGTGSKLLVGIVAGGFNCTVPAVFTQLSHYNDWINEKTGNAANFLKLFDLHFLLFIVALQSYVH